MTRDRVSIRVGISADTADAAAAVEALGALVQRGVEELHARGLLTASTLSLQILPPQRKRWPKEAQR